MKWPYHYVIFDKLQLPQPLNKYKELPAKFSLHWPNVNFIIVWKATSKEVVCVLVKHQWASQSKLLECLYNALNYHKQDHYTVNCKSFEIKWPVLFSYFNSDQFLFSLWAGSDKLCCFLKKRNQIQRATHCSLQHFDFPFNLVHQNIGKTRSETFHLPSNQRYANIYCKAWLNPKRILKSHSNVQTNVRRKEKVIYLNNLFPSAFVVRRLTYQMELGGCLEVQIPRVQDGAISSPLFQFTLQHDVQIPNSFFVGSNEIF